MKSAVRNVAACFAVLIFFLMSSVGLLAGLSPATACYRAVSGAAIIYVVTTVAGRTVVNIIVSALVRSRIKKLRQGNNF